MENLQTSGLDIFEVDSYEVFEIRISEIQDGQQIL